MFTITVLLLLLLLLYGSECVCSLQALAVAAQDRGLIYHPLPLGSMTRPEKTGRDESQNELQSKNVGVLQPAEKPHLVNTDLSFLCKLETCPVKEYVECKSFPKSGLGTGPQSPLDSLQNRLEQMEKDLAELKEAEQQRVNHFLLRLLSLAFSAYAAECLKIGLTQRRYYEPSIYELLRRLIRLRGKHFASTTQFQRKPLIM